MDITLLIALASIFLLGLRLGRLQEKTKIKSEQNQRYTWYDCE